MNRKKIMNGINDIILNSDILFCVGKPLVSEAKFHSEQTVFYHPDDSVDVISVAVGVAMSTEKRVIIIMEDCYLLRHINSILQAVVSKCKNLYLFLIVSNVYNTLLIQETIFSVIRDIRSTMFSLGFFTYNHSNYFKSKPEIKKLKEIFKAARGPFITFIELTDSKVYKNELNINSILEFCNGIKSTDTELPKIHSVLDLDSIMVTI